jgi:hypothetical protein
MLLGAASLAAAQQPAETPPAQLPSVKLPPELARVLTDYEAAWRVGDGAALARLFDEEGSRRRDERVTSSAAFPARKDSPTSGSTR